MVEFISGLRANFLSENLETGAKDLGVFALINKLNIRIDTSKIRILGIQQSPCCKILAHGESDAFTNTFYAKSNSFFGHIFGVSIQVLFVLCWKYY